MVQHVGFLENVNNSELDKAICTKFSGKMRHRHAEMTPWSKVETESNNSRDVIKWTSSDERLDHKCVDLSDYNRYLNQVLYKAQAPHY